jgi:hypothetical protein
MFNFLGWYVVVGLSITVIWGVILFLQRALGL